VAEAVCRSRRAPGDWRRDGVVPFDSKEVSDLAWYDARSGSCRAHRSPRARSGENRRGDLVQVVESCRPRTFRVLSTNSRLSGFRREKMSRIIGTDSSTTCRRVAAVEVLRRLAPCERIVS